MSICLNCNIMYHIKGSQTKLVSKMRVYYNKFHMNWFNHLELPWINWYPWIYSTVFTFIFILLLLLFLFLCRKENSDFIWNEVWNSKSYPVRFLFHMLTYLNKTVERFNKSQTMIDFCVTSGNRHDMVDKPLIFEKS